MQDSSLRANHEDIQKISRMYKENADLDDISSECGMSREMVLDIIELIKMD